MLAYLPGMDLKTTVSPMTIEDLYALPDDGQRHELLAGVLISEPPPGMRHGRVIARIVEVF